MSDDAKLIVRGRGLRAGVAVAAVVAFVAPASAAVAGATEPGGSAGARTVRVSLADDGGQPDRFSGGPEVSANGRYVAYISAATNLVPGDTNDVPDVFVWDRRTRTTERVNLSSSGVQAVDGAHSGVRISADGRYVAFTSYADNLVPGDTNENSDVFIRDRVKGLTSRVSVSSAGVQGDNFSAFSLGLSSDGRYVLFDSDAANLVPGDTNGFRDVFLHDRHTSRTSRVSTATDGTQGNHQSQAPAISADGRYVVFESFAGNLVPGDANDQSDVFLRDRRTGRTALVSATPAGIPGLYNSFSPSISADGRLIAFMSDSPDLVEGDANGTVDVFVRDRRARQTTLVSLSDSGVPANDHCNSASISADGRYVVFHSPATTLVPGDTNAGDDVFVRDLDARTTSLVSVTTSGRQANDWSGDPSVSADGRVIAYLSYATNLVPGDTNEQPDVFARIR
ncbi:hypothetical protein OHA21_21320 [Actinoplanes sp. NBC_00393]|uniref:TolB family protein n=1 Tax=Actinoplanes sp. NBC_00393 TaxID=2975953 RepID=UPI002E1B9696